MSPRRRPWGAAAAAFVPAALIFALVAPTNAFAAPADPGTDYPTWQDVQKAKRSQAATAAEIERIEGILVALEQQAIELGRTAQVKAEEYAVARDALAAAEQKVERLTARAAAAQERADESSARAARLIAQLARTGGGDLTLGLIMGSASDTDQLLSRLSSMNRLTESSTDILARAQFDQNLAASLNDDAKVAETARQSISDQAEVALDAAQAASDKAESDVAQQNKNADRMYAQLASLKNTTAEIEREYREGLEQQEENEPAPSNPNPGTSNPPSNPSPNPTPSSSPTTPPGVDPTPDPPVASAVQKAISYAKAQLGEPYKFAGAGPSSWDCSGLTKMSYNSAGVYIGTHSVSNQYATMKSQGRLVRTNALKAGDLLFYSYGGSTSGGFYHVTMYIGNGQMIEAPRPGVNVRIVAYRTYDLVPYAGRPTG